MATELQCKVAAAILRFLQEHELAKTAKALLKEASKLEWDLGDDADAQQFNLMQLCAAEEQRQRQQGPLNGVSKRRKKSQVESPSEAADEGQRPKNKCRQQSKQQETPQAEADVEVHHESSTADISKKSRKHMSLEEDENGEQTEPVAAEESEPPQKKPKNDKGIKRFQRVDESQWTSNLPAELKDNSFWKKKNDNFAAKAAEQLGRVRGKDFRHEKTKKKKATWKGCGEIPMTVNSIQFASDSE